MIFFLSVQVNDINVNVHQVALVQMYTLFCREVHIRNKLSGRTMFVNCHIRINGWDSEKNLVSNE